MKFTPATLALAAVLTMVSSVGVGQKPDSEINAASLAWQVKGDRARSAGSMQEANDAYESALAADPRNRAAFIALGDVARAQGLQGKAVRYYNGALTLEPNDMKALGGIVEALADRGAMGNARETLSRMKQLCRGDCPQIADLSALLDRKTMAQAALGAKDVAQAPDAKALAQQP